jgi:gas vesicle protein
MQQRDDELRNYAPPQPITITKDNVENIQIDIQEIDNDAKTKKSVSWSEEMEDFAWLKSQVLELSKKMLQLQEKIDSQYPSSSPKIDYSI